MRASPGRVTAVIGVAGVVALVIVVLLMLRGEEEEQVVERSTSSNFPGRGSLIDDQEVLEGAAQAWRDDTQGRDEDSRPGDSISVLYAGRADGSKIGASGDDRDVTHDVVVLSSSGLVSTVKRPAGGSWDAGSSRELRADVSQVDPVLDLGSNAYLVAEGRFDQETPAVALPAAVAEDDDVADDADEPEAFTADLSDPLWLPDQRSSGPTVLRLRSLRPGDDAYVGQVWLNWDSPSGSDDDFALSTSSVGGASAADQLWEQLVDPEDSAGTTAAFQVALDSLQTGDNGRSNFRSGVSTGMTIRSLGTGGLVDTPDGERRLHGLAVGFGTTGSADVVAVGLTFEDVAGVVRTSASVLGRRQTSVREAIPIAARWLTPESGSRPYLLFAADPELERVELRVGAEIVDTERFIGVYQPPADPDGDGRPPTTMIGFDQGGISYPSFPITALG